MEVDPGLLISSIETVFSNLSYSEAAAVFGADPFLCSVYDIEGGVLQWFVTICCAIALRLKYRGSKFQEEVVVGSEYVVVNSPSI